MLQSLSGLNREQKRAVTFGKGPVLIVAGAGTGKTAVLTNRIAYLIKKKYINPEEFLAVTFTEKAAEEMEERVDKMLPYGYVDLWISTFHSFCKRVLENHGLEIGQSTDFKLLDETASWLFMRQNLEKLKLNLYKPLGNPNKFIHALISHFSHCKDQGIYPDSYLKYSAKTKGEERKKTKEIGYAYLQYQKLLLEKNFLDFGDLINYCLHLFQKRPLVLEEYRQKFKYILVDEFQDTNWIQYKLVKALSAPRNNLMVCADDDQAIYKWRGASFTNILQFRKDFPKARQIVLVKNYRSTQNILDLSYKFIQLNNPNRLEKLNKINKNLLAESKKKGIIDYLDFRSLEQEAQGVVDKIIEILKKDKKSDFNDFAILVRANSFANIFSRALGRAGLPYRFMALRGLYSKPVILDIISYFKLLDDYHENSSAYRILNLPFLKISTKDISEITHYSQKKSQSIYQSLINISLVPNLSKKTQNKIKKFTELIEKHSILATQKNVSEVFVVFLTEIGYLNYLVESEDEEGISYVNQFFNKIKSFEETNLDPCLRNFMEGLNLEIESGEQGKLSFDIEQGPEVIRVMTIHAAKGLEFKYVFLVNLVDRRVPSPNRKELIEIPVGLTKDIVPEGDIHLEEERRIFYVGMTRAKRGLFFTSAENYGGRRKKKLSRFLIELGRKRGGKTEKNDDKNIQINKKIKIRKKGKKEISLPKYFSFTQLRAFESCPLQYKLAHILKIPVRGKAVFSYGKTIHDTLCEFLKETKKRLTFKDLLLIYKKEWIDDWYESKEQKEEYFKFGKKALKVFYTKSLKTKPSILFIEGGPALEQVFNLKIGGETFIGKIDRIDKVKNGIELIDYKTGRVSDKLKAKDKEQLLIYQIAAEEVFKLVPKKLTYYYLDGGKKLSFLGSETEKEEQRQKIISQIKKIKNSNFLPTPGWQCKTCDFKDICEKAKR